VETVSELRHNTVVKLNGGPALKASDDPRTRDAVARSILENGPSTAAALGERLGLTPAGIRRHLDLLTADGILEAREPRISSTRGRGRPSKVFVMTDSGREKFEHSYDDLAVAALKFMSAQSGEHLVSAFAQSRADDIERKATIAIAKSSQKLDALASFLTEQGYAASVETRATGVELCQHHCPIAHVASEFPQLCEAETEAFSKLLGTHVQRLATIAHGDGVCTTYIPNINSKIQIKEPLTAGKARS
jgi:predicted ArsR family transcriptional regulator